MSSPPNISSLANFPLCIQCWSLMTFIISSSSVSIWIIDSFLLFCTFLLFSFPFCIQCLYSCTFACLYFNYFESYPFMHLVLTVWLSMYHIGHKNQRNAKANKSAGQTRKSSSTTLCAIDVETRSCLRYPLHTYAHSKRQTYLVTPPLPSK